MNEEGPTVKKRKKLSDEEVKIELDKKSEEAEDLLKDPEKLERVLEQLERKLKKIPVLGEPLANVPMMISLVRSFAKKEYLTIPMGSLIAIIGALLYFLSPIDIIPDGIPGVGYIDDGVIVAGAIKLVHDDIVEYEAWQKKNGKRLLDEPEK